MPRSNAHKTEITESESSTDSELQQLDFQTVEETEEQSERVESERVEDAQDIDDILNSLKLLLSTVEKLQKVRQDIGDIKPLLLKMLDGELVSGEDLEQLKAGVGGLVRLVRAHSDHQAALTKAQSARMLLDEVLGTPVS